MKFQFLLPLVTLFRMSASQPHEVTFTANNLPFTISFDLSRFALLNTAETFCRQKAEDLGIKDLESLVLGCIPPVVNVLREDVAKALGAGATINSGELSADTMAYIAAAQAARAEAEKQAVPQTISTAGEASATTSNSVEVTIYANDKPYTIAMDRTVFTLIAAAEAFCRQKADELGVTTFDLLVLECIPQAANIIRTELVKRFDPESIPVGEMSAESRAWLAQTQQRQAQAQAAATTQAASVRTPERPKTASIGIIANDKPYNIVIDLAQFTVLSSAEDFCRARAQDLGITTYDALVLGCLPKVAEVIRRDLAKTFDPASIPIGDETSLTADSRAWLVEQERAAAAAAAETARAAAAAAPVKMVYEIAMPVDDVTYTIGFDLRTSTPMSVAESFCDSRELGLTSLETLVYTCIPQVAAFVKRAVDAQIAPQTVAIGQSSDAVQRVVARLSQAQQGV